MLIVACRLMTSGVNGVSLLGSSVFKFCSKINHHRHQSSDGDATIGASMIRDSISAANSALLTCSRNPPFLLILLACTVAISV